MKKEKEFDIAAFYFDCFAEYEENFTEQSDTEKRLLDLGDSVFSKLDKSQSKMLDELVSLYDEYYYEKSLCLINFLLEILFPRK